MVRLDASKGGSGLALSYFLITVPIGGPMGESPNALVTLHILRMFLVFATTFSLGTCKAHFV